MRPEDKKMVIACSAGGLIMGATLGAVLSLIGSFAVAMLFSDFGFIAYTVRFFAIGGGLLGLLCGILFGLTHLPSGYE